MWQARIGPDPVIAGHVVVATTTGGIQAFDALSGRALWTWTNPRQSVAVEFRIAGGIVVAVFGHRNPPSVASVAAELDAVDLHSGRLLWSHPIRSVTQSPGLAAAGPVIAIVDDVGTVTGLDPRTGTTRWQEARPATCADAIGLVTPGGLVYATSALAGDGNALAVGRQCGTAAGQVQRLDPTTGRAAWTVTGPTSNFAEFAIPQASNVLVASGLGAFVVWDVATGKQDWQRTGLGDVTAVSGDAGTICVNDLSGYECRHTKTGALAFPPATSGEVVGMYGDSSPVVAAQGRAYELVNGTRLVVRSTASGAVITTVRLDAAVTGLVTAGNGTLLVRRSYDVLAISPLWIGNGR